MAFNPKEDRFKGLLNPVNRISDDVPGEIMPVPEIRIKVDDKHLSPENRAFLQSEVPPAPEAEKRDELKSSDIKPNSATPRKPKSLKPGDVNSQGDEDLGNRSR